MANLKRRIHPWFFKSDEAFRRSFPSVAKDVPFDVFYVCPQCLVAFGQDAWETRFLTRDHVPPKNVGGKRMALTCHPCNTTVGGADLDCHVRREADFYDFMTGRLKETQAHLRTKSGRVPIRLTVTDGAMSAAVVQDASVPEEYERVIADFAALLSPTGGRIRRTPLSLSRFRRNGQRLGG